MVYSNVEISLDEKNELSLESLENIFVLFHRSLSNVCKICSINLTHASSYWSHIVSSKERYKITKLLFLDSLESCLFESMETYSSCPFLGVDIRDSSFGREKRNF